MSTLERTEEISLSRDRRGGRTGWLVLLGMTVVVMFTNDSAREYLKVPIGEVHLIERDFFLYGLLALYLLNVVVSGRSPRMGAFGVHTLAIFGLYYLSVVNGLARGNEPKQVFFHLRQVNYLLVYFPFLHFVSSPERLRGFLRLALGCAVVAACATFLLAVRYAASDLVVKNEFVWITGGAWGGFFHVRVATAFFFGIVFSCVVAMWALRCKELFRKAQLLLCGLMGGALILTVLRSYWLGLAVSALLLLLMVKYRTRLLVVGVFVTGAALLAMYLFLPESDIGGFIRERWLSSLDRDSIAVADRILEHYIGMDLVRQSPWIGNGLGATIVVRLQSIGMTIETSFSHNSFLTMLMFFGVVGCAFLAGVFVLVARKGVRALGILEQKGDRFGMAIVGGCLAGLGGLVVTSVTAAAMNYATGFFFIGAVLGVTDRLMRFAALEGKGGG